MNLNPLAWLKRNKSKTLAVFGEARLLQRPTGRIELVGGKPEDRTAAKEWASLFLHEAAF